ncbi:MAG: ATP-binding protein [Chloroflexota bacterium]|nr:ATP-binding protein [Chloroflexota bacterium]
MFRTLFLKARWRMVGWNVAIMTIFLIVLGGAIYGLFSTRIYIEGDQQLIAEKAMVETDLEAKGWDSVRMIQNPAFADSPYRIVVAASDGTVNYTTDCPPQPFRAPCLPQDFKALNKDAVRVALNNGNDIRTMSFRHEPVRALTFSESFPHTNAQFVIQISHDASGEEDALRELRLLLILGGALGILLAGLGSVFLAGRALVPIRQAFARQRQFTADASHELRTPLALVRANAEMLERGGESLRSADAELVHEIIRETDHLNRLIGDLLTLARADSESTSIESKPVDFRTLVASVHEDLSLIAESRGIASDIALNGAITVQGDEVRLRQLLLILLDNALKYTDPGGRVDLSLARVNNRAYLTVADSGIGIPQADLVHIFERFYRVDRSREHESGGTGLGLAIAHWIVDAHQGNIKVDSKLGRGTKIVVELPAGG